jgi:phage tail sheath protein FI
MLFGDKTGAVATSTLSRINVARLFVYLKNIIGRAARTILFELNDTTTRNLFINAVTPVLRNIQGSRGITDFRVICDESNNTADVVDSNQFIADIMIKPTKSVNFIRIRFTNKSESADLG